MLKMQINCGYFLRYFVLYPIFAAEVGNFSIQEFRMH